ncbi:MAG: DUF2232 domain-containing protein [Alphaproteobacteria bacterium]|nr:DUF2232 domain-containing protein [Alphaproteobacteria bacterium]
MVTLYTPLVAIVAGIVCGAFYVIGLSYSLWGMFLVLCSPLPIYIAGLKWGSLASGMAGIFAVMGVVIFGDLLLASVFSIAFVMPAFLLAHLATQPVGGTTETPQWLSAAGLTQALLIIGLLQVVTATVAVSMTDGGLTGTIRSNLSLLLETIYGARSSHGPDAVTDVVDIVDFWGALVLGAILAVIAMTHATMGTLAQGLVASNTTPLRPSPSFWRLRLPAWPAILAMLLGLTVFILDTISDGPSDSLCFLIYLFSGFFLVLCVGFLLQGLAVLHALTRGMGAQPFILAGSYMVVLVFQPFGAMVFAAIGFAERWANFRERFGVDLDTSMED